MTNEELAELERLLANATPGPLNDRWEVSYRRIRYEGTTQAVNIDEEAALIVALRNAAPSLIATTIRALKENPNAG